MRKGYVFLLAILLAVGIKAGCGSDIDEEPLEPAVLLQTFPKSGADIAATANILLEFDKAPENITTDPVRAFYFATENPEIPDSLRSRIQDPDKTVVIPGPFLASVFEIKVFWGNTVPKQSVTLRYIVASPD